MMAATRTAPKIDLGDDQFNSFSTSSGCPSTTSNFLAIDTLPWDPVTHRRQSVASSATSTDQGIFSSSSGGTASPCTPLTAEYLTMTPSGDSAICMPNELSLQGMCNGRKCMDHSVDPIWTTVDPSCHNSAAFLDCLGTDALEAQDMFNDLGSSHDWHLLSTSAANLSFSQAIIEEHHISSEEFSTDIMGQWTPKMVHTPPQTVAPNATFQPTSTSSPSKLESLTPLRYPAPAPASILPSSPCAFFSPRQIPTPDEYELADQLLEAAPITPKQVPKVRRGSGRSGRATCERKCLGGSGRMKSAVSKSGMACDVVIEGNKYACEFADCMDKNGKRKMFKRREHAKRHVDTVHLKKKQFRCWVPGCTTQPFTRSDNLTTHLKSTHGKKSVSSRNRYVSTLDPASANFDPEWRGDLDDDGYPVDDHGAAMRSIRSRLGSLA